MVGFNLVGILRSDDYYPTLGIPIFEEPGGKRFVAEEAENRVQYFEPIEVDVSRFLKGEWGVSKSFSTGDEMLHGLVINPREAFVGDIAYFRSCREKLEGRLQGYPFFQMEYYELIGDRERFRNSALQAAISLKNVGTYLLNIWLQSGNVDKETINFIVSNIDVGASTGFQETGHLRVHGPKHFVNALQRVLLGSGSVLADSEVRLDLTTKHLDAVLADKDFMRAMTPLSEDDLCRKCKISFVHPLNTSIVTEELTNIFGAAITIEPLFTNHAARKIEQLVRSYADHPVFGTDSKLHALRIIACTIHHRRSEILEMYQQSVEYDADHARQEILTRIALRHSK